MSTEEDHATPQSATDPTVPAADTHLTKGSLRDPACAAKTGSGLAQGEGLRASSPDATTAKMRRRRRYARTATRPAGKQVATKKGRTRVAPDTTARGFFSAPGFGPTRDAGPR